MNLNVEEDAVELELVDELSLEQLDDSGAAGVMPLGSFGSVGCFGSSVGSCASTVSTGSTFS